MTTAPGRSQSAWARVYCWLFGHKWVVPTDRVAHGSIRCDRCGWSSRG